MPNNAHVKAMRHVGLDDDEVRLVANRVALKALLHAEQVIDHGAPELKIRIIHSLLPAIAGMLREGELDAAKEDLKSEFHEMIRKMQQPRELEQAQEM